MVSKGISQLVFPLAYQTEFRGIEKIIIQFFKHFIHLKSSVSPIPKMSVLVINFYIKYCPKLSELKKILMILWVDS